MWRIYNTNIPYSPENPHRNHDNDNNDPHNNNNNNNTNNIHNIATTPPRDNHIPHTNLNNNNNNNNNNNQEGEPAHFSSLYPSANNSANPSANNSANTSANTSPSLTPLQSAIHPTLNLNFSLNDPPPSSSSSSSYNYSSSSSTYSNTASNSFILNVSPPPLADASGYLSCHTSVGLDDRLFIFGGLYKKEKRNEVLVYHLDDGYWETPKVKGQIPSTRYCHATCLYKPDNRLLTAEAALQSTSPRPKVAAPAAARLTKPTMVVFGGLAHIRLNDIHLLDIGTMTWSSVIPAGMLPLERSHHSAVLFGHHMVIFGGLADTGQRLNDVHILDLETMCWVQPLVSGIMPPPRLAHSAEVYANRMVIFGGYDGKIRMNDVYLLDFGTMRWSQPLLQGPPPVPRFGQTMTLVGSKVVVFGGSSGATNLLTNDHVAILDLETLEWAMVRPTGPTPFFLHYHTANLYRDKIVFYGGIKKFNGFIILDIHSIEELKNRDFHDARAFVQSVLNQSIETVSDILQKETARGTVGNVVEGVTKMSEVLKSVDHSVKIIFGEMRRQLVLLTENDSQNRERTRQQQEELENARATFEYQKTKMEEINRRQQTKVKLNIGGTRYETSVSTLAKDGTSMLAAMFSGLYPITPDREDGSIFIDRDGTHFRYILNYLRDGDFSPPRDVLVLKELLQEAQFYQIDGLISKLKQILYPDAEV